MRDEDGLVQCRGQNDVGQLGDGTTTARDALGPVLDLGRSAQVDLWSAPQGCAVDRQGVLRCWGDNTDLYAGRNFGPEPPVLTTPRRVEGFRSVTEVETTRVGTCALSRTGGVSCFGRQVWATDEPAHGPVPNLGRATHLVGGESHFCATLADGHVRCWGADGMGQLGGTLVPNVMRDPNALITVRDIDDATTIAAGCAFNCVLRRSGTVSCWGGNDSGQLGPGHADEPTSEAPLMVDGASGARAIGAGCAHGCAETGDGTILCWGSNDQGQLGTGTTSETTGLVTLPARGRLHVLDFATCVDEGGDALRCFGDLPGVATRADRDAPVAVVGLPARR